jgi:hypothetical protein
MQAGGLEPSSNGAQPLTGESVRVEEAKLE